MKESGGNPLWTRNFTIITVGTAVSLFGEAISGFATALLVLDFTGSVFLFSLYMILTTLPRIFMPTLAGPFLDRFSRRRAIYLLDFLSAGIYVVFGIVLMTGSLSYPLLLIGCVSLGSISSVYTVAYDSFYPLLITKGNMRKAYSISSTMESIVMVLTPVSAFLYHQIGIAPLFFLNAVCFTVAALFEMQIRVEESYTLPKGETFGARQYGQTFREGIAYLRSEPGLLAICLYFMFTSFNNGSFQVVVLPHFREVYEINGDYLFIFVEGFMVFGRMLAGAFHYRHKIRPERKFRTAFIVYCCISLIGSFYLFTPIPLMMALMLVSGMLSMTSYNIRISSTQSYVPDGKKGRYNGTFQMMNTVGALAGEFCAGLIADHMDKRLVILLFGLVDFTAAWALMFRRRREVAVIYNRET